MTTFLRRVQDCTRHDLTSFAPFHMAGRPVGWVRKDMAPLFATLEGFSATPEGLILAPAPDTPAARTQALSRASALLEQTGRANRHGEIYPVVEKWADTPLAEIDRAAIQWFGLRGFGVHANGFVRKPDGLYVWIAQRALDRWIDPGKLDNLIGGGIGIGHTADETLVKEAWEEAGIPADLAARSLATGTLSYTVEIDGHLRDGTLFIYDLELPEDFTPTNTDGEVDHFELRPAAEIAAIVRETEDFKFNCNLVIIDFLLRHGLIGPDHPEYSALIDALRPVRGS